MLKVKSRWPTPCLPNQQAHPHYLREPRVRDVGLRSHVIPRTYVMATLSLDIDPVTKKVSEELNRVTTAPLQPILAIEQTPNLVQLIKI